MLQLSIIIWKAMPRAAKDAKNIPVTVSSSDAGCIGIQTRAGKLRLSIDNSAKSLWVLASFVGNAPSLFPIDIRALINSCWGANLGAPQVPKKEKNILKSKSNNQFYIFEHQLMK